MRIQNTALALAALALSACGVKVEEHQAVVAQLAEANQKLEAATKATAEADAKATAAAAKADAWKKATGAIAGLAGVEVELYGLTRAHPVDCAKLGASLDEHLGKNLRAPLAKSLSEAEAAVGKADLDAAGWSATVAKLDAETDAFSASLAKACPKEADALAKKLATARKGETPPAAPAAEAPAAPAAPAADAK